MTQAAGPEHHDAEEQNNIDVYKKRIPSVVNITSRQVAYDFFYGLVPQEGQGSGFIIDKKGYILTNYHVVENARALEVTLHNRKKYHAEIVGTDPSHDLAVIQIKAPDLVPATLGDSKVIDVGQKVYAIGNPFRTLRHSDHRNRKFHPPRPGARTARKLTKPFKPMPPSIPETPAARCSTIRAKSSASTP